MAKTYDPECYNLAEHFLQNEPLSDDKIELAKACVDLAQHIQQAIEDWFDTPAVKANRGEATHLSGQVRSVAQAVAEPVAWRILCTTNGATGNLYTEKLPFEPGPGIHMRREPEPLYLSVAQVQGMDELEAALRDAQAFISTALVSDINPTISKKALMQRIGTALSSVPLAQAARHPELAKRVVEFINENDPFGDRFCTNDVKQIEAILSLCPVSSTREGIAPLTVWPSTGSFLGYRDASGNEMHCRHMTCPHEIDCRKRCICPTAVTSKHQRATVVGKVTGTVYEGDQVSGMPGAICHACGLKDYPCVNPDCPNRTAQSLQDRGTP